MNNAILYVVLVLDLFFIVILVRELLNKKESKKINVLVYNLLLVTIFTLYFMAQTNDINISSNNYLGIFFNSITATRDSLLLKFNYSYLTTSFNDSLLFTIVYVITLLIAYYYLARLIIKLFFKRIQNYITIKRRLKKDVCIVIGNNEQGRMFIKANPDSSILWDPSVLDYSFPTFKGQFNVLNFKKLSKHKNVEFLMFTDSQEGIYVANAFIESLDELDYSNSNIFLTLVVDKLYNQIFSSVLEKGRGLIKISNKYDIIAKEFIKEHPLSKYVDHKMIDYDTGLIDNDVNIHVTFIGFGNVNEHIYVSTVANSQFLTEEAGEIKAKPVKYFIFEKDDKQYNKNLNHTFFRYDRTNFIQDEYLELPEPIHKTTFKQLDINSIEFYEELDKIITTKRTKNFIVVSIDSDLENLDFVIKLKERIEYIGLNDVELFVRIQNYEPLSLLLKANEDLKHIKVFGSYQQYINKEILFNRTHYSTAIKLATDYELTKNNEEEIVEQKLDEQDGIKNIKEREVWQDLEIFKQESNIFAILNINFKLNLLGYSIYDENLTETSINEFMAFYDKDEKRLIEKRADYVISKPFYIRDVMAFQEHSRWNAFHIINGYVPLKKDEISLNYTKDTHLKLHACLTTFNGLDEFHEILVKLKQNKIKEDKNVKDKDKTKDELFCEVEVKKYDYNIFDKLAGYLSVINQTIKKKSFGDVYIEYHKGSLSIVEKAVFELEKEKIKCFYHPRDFRGKINEVISSAKVFLLVLDEKLNNDSSILNKVENAYQKGKQIVVLKLFDGKINEELNKFINDAVIVDNNKLELHELVLELKKEIKKYT